MSAPTGDQVYRRVGRGGAGNWYSKKDVDEAEKAQQQAVSLIFLPIILFRYFLDPRYPAYRLTPQTLWWKQDIEAQKDHGTSAAGPANPIAASTQYHRAGRGGAGNFHDPAPTNAITAGTDKADGAVDPVAVQQQEEQIAKIKAAVAAQKPRTGGMGGRGGVGNWSNSNSLSAQQQERQEKEEQKRVQEVELNVLRDVDAGLAMPKPAYQRAAVEREE